MFEIKATGKIIFKRRVRPAFCQLFSGVLFFISSCSAGSGTQTGLNYQPVQVTPLRQRYFDQNMFNLIKAQSANCSRVIERMGTPELHINDSNGVQMIFFFSVPVVLLESEKKENGRTGSFSTLGISDYSLYRKMILSFDNNCNLKNAEYEATLKG